MVVVVFLPLLVLDADGPAANNYIARALFSLILFRVWEFTLGLGHNHLPLLRIYSHAAHNKTWWPIFLPPRHSTFFIFSSSSSLLAAPKTHLPSPLNLKSYNYSILYVYGYIYGNFTQSVSDKSQEWRPPPTSTPHTFTPPILFCSILLDHWQKRKPTIRKVKKSSVLVQEIYRWNIS